jgi:hypothetical protein
MSRASSSTFLDRDWATHRASLAPAVCALLLVVAGCGGSTDEPRPLPTGSDSEYPGYLGAPMAPAAAGPVNCMERTDIALEKIEDFELGAAGGWYLSNDVCSNCQDFINQSDAIRNGTEQVTDPAAELERLANEFEACLPSCLAVNDAPYYFDNPPVAEAIEGGRCGSRYAMHIKGGPFIEWGGNMGRNISPPLNLNNVEITDESGAVRPAQFIGVAFWARLGDTGGNNALRLELGEKHTDQNYMGVDGAADGEGPVVGSICTPDTTDLNSDQGCDKFGSSVLLRSDWQQFLVPFAEMRQGGWGRPAEYFDLAGIISFSISFPQGTWDFWIDDLAFYRRPQ